MVLGLGWSDRPSTEGEDRMLRRVLTSASPSVASHLAPLLCCFVLGIEPRVPGMDKPSVLHTEGGKHHHYCNMSRPLVSLLLSTAVPGSTGSEGPHGHYQGTKDHEQPRP